MGMRREGEFHYKLHSSKILWNNFQNSVNVPKRIFKENFTNNSELVLTEEKSIDNEVHAYIETFKTRVIKVFFFVHRYFALLCKYYVI